MAIVSLNTLRERFKKGLKPTGQHFWDVFDSFFHKNEKVPSASIGGLQELLDSKMDIKAVVSPDQVGVYDPAKNYVFDALIAEYVSFSNPNSENDQFKTEKFYRLKKDAPAGENPETHPAHWAYQGTTIGEITIDDVVGLQETLDNKVDKLSGKGLSTEDYTTSEKNKLASLNVHNRGTYTTLAALQTAIPLGDAGDEAVIDAGVGSDAQKAIWDTSDNVWVIAGGGTIAVDAVPTKDSNAAVSSGGVYKVIKQTFVVESTTDYGTITAPESFKINSIVAENGLTVSIKKSDDSDYTPGDTLAAFEQLRLFGDTLNKSFTVIGEIV